MSVSMIILGILVLVIGFISPLFKKTKQNKTAEN